MKNFVLHDVLDSTAALGFLTVLAVLLPAAAVRAQAIEADPGPSRWVGVEVGIDSVPALVATLNRSGGDLPTPHGMCSQELKAHTDADFTGGTFTIQAGFAENEIAATSFVVDAADFPLRINLMEMIFAQNHANFTTTVWQAFVWEGNPSTGTQVFTVQSDDVILPHLNLPFLGVNGVNIQLSIDPGDPDQIIVNDDGSHTFSVGYGIVQHNNQIGSGCTLGDIPPSSNAFPTTDVSGLAAPGGNWLEGINCGFFGCPPNGGWSTFQGLSPGCRPSGDWIMRVTYTPLDCVLPTGACCAVDGTCSPGFTSAQCGSINGTYQGDESGCSPNPCPEPTGGCCIGAGCVVLTQTQCNGAEGVYSGDGSDCTGNACTPGICCIAPFGCFDLIEGVCLAQGGFFGGAGTFCTPFLCPATGACCTNIVPGLDCLINQTESNCNSIAGAWGGAATICEDLNMNEISDVCEELCGGATGDVNGDTFVDGLDANAFIQAMFGSPTPAEVCAGDFDGQNGLDPNDVPGLVAAMLAG